MQIGDWGNVLIRHVCEQKHQKYSPWACPFSGVKFHGAFHFQKIIFLQLLQIWSSYCFHCDTDQLWRHTQSNNKTKCFKQILTVKNLTSHLRTFWHWVIHVLALIAWILPFIDYTCSVCRTHCQQLSVITTITQYWGGSFLPRTIRDWNSLSIVTVEATTVDTFVSCASHWPVN